MKFIIQRMLADGLETDALGSHKDSIEVLKTATDGFKSSYEDMADFDKEIAFAVINTTKPGEALNESDYLKYKAELYPQKSGKKPAKKARVSAKKPSVKKFTRGGLKQRAFTDGFTWDIIPTRAQAILALDANHEVFGLDFSENTEGAIENLENLDAYSVWGLEASPQPQKKPAKKADKKSKVSAKKPKPGIPKKDWRLLSTFSAFKNKRVVKFEEVPGKKKYKISMASYPDGAQLASEIKSTPLEGARAYMRVIGKHTDGVIAMGSFTEWASQNMNDYPALIKYAKEQGATLPAHTGSDKNNNRYKPAKKKISSKTSGPATAESKDLKECRDVMKNAGFTITKSTKKGKDGKTQTVATKVKRTDRTIIKDKVSGVFKTVNKEVAKQYKPKTSDPVKKKAEIDKIKKSTESATKVLEDRIAQIMRNIDRLVAHGDADGLNKLGKALNRLL